MKKEKEAREGDFMEGERVQRERERDREKSPDEQWANLLLRTDYPSDGQVRNDK